jgi:chromosome segregation ATPase
MRISKKIILLLTFMMSLTGIQAAFADTSNSSPDANSVTASTYGNTATTSTYSTDSGLIAQIDQLYTQLLDLRVKDKDLAAKMKAQDNQNDNALKALRTNENAADIQIIKDTEAKNKAILASNQSLLDQFKSLEKQYKQARAAKDEKGSVTLRIQINTLKSQVKAVQDQIKANNNDIKATKQKVEAARNQLKILLDPIKAIGLQMKQQWSDIKGLEQQKEDSWKSFNKAVNSGDANSAFTALTQIVTLKKQIMDDKQKVYSEEQQITIIISASAASKTTP